MAGGSKNFNKIGIDTDDKGFQSPTKDAERQDGHYSTPQKRKLTFDFFGSDSSAPKLLNLEMLRIADLKHGKYFKQAINFRVTLKTHLKSITNAGVMFTFHGLDESGEIAIVAFRTEAEKNFDVINVNDVFKLTTFFVKEESEKYKSGTGHSFQVILQSDSSLELLKESFLPDIPFNFMCIDKIHQETDVNSKTDVIGILVSDWGLETTSNNFKKRDLSITDQSKKTVCLTLWGTAAEKFDGKLFQPIAVRKGVVSEFNGDKSINTRSDTLVWMNPVINEGFLLELTEWFESAVRDKKN